MGFPLGVAALIGGYAIAYWGVVNFRNGGQGPSFAEVLGLKSTVDIEPPLTKGLKKGGTLGGSTIGQPPSTVASPGGGVWT